MHLSAKEREEERRAILAKQKHLEEVLRQKRETEAKAQAENISDQEMVDNIFGFLPNVVIGGQEGQAPVGFEVQPLTLMCCILLRLWCVGLIMIIMFFTEH